jgi:hypothetical protein
MKAVEVRFKVKDVWRTLVSEKLISITYPGFLKWVKALKINYEHGITYEDQIKLRHYALLRSRSERKTVHRVDSKLRAIAAMKKVGDSITFGQAIQIAETCGVCSGATLYRRAKLRNFKLSAKEFYDTQKMIDFVLGRVPGL